MLVYADGLDSSLIERYSSSTIHFSRRPLDMRQVAAECDLAIVNANQASLSALLLAGKRSFLLPLFLEQYLLSVRLQQQGFCEFANPHDAAAVEAGLRKMLATPDYAAAAGRFATKYADYDPLRAISELVTRFEKLSP